MNTCGIISYWPIWNNLLKCTVAYVHNKISLHSKYIFTFTNICCNTRCLKCVYYRVLWQVRNTYYRIPTATSNFSDMVRYLKYFHRNRDEQHSSIPNSHTRKLSKCRLYLLQNYSKQKICKHIRFYPKQVVIIKN